MRRECRICAASDGHAAFGAPHPLGRRTTSRRAVLFRITVCKSSFALRLHPWQRIVIIATRTRPVRTRRMPTSPVDGTSGPASRCSPCPCSNSAEWRDAAARRGPAVQKTHAARDVRVRRLRQSVHGICPTCTACAAVRTRARACLSSSVVTRRRPSVGLSRQSLGSTVVAVAVSAAIFIAVTVAVAGIVPARRARFRPCTRRARKVLRRSQGREGPKAEKD